jgi:hypothetical protein
MMGLVSSDELANDVTGAEALLERHQVMIKFLLRKQFTKELHTIFHMVTIVGMKDPQHIKGMQHHICLRLFS